MQHKDAEKYSPRVEEKVGQLLQCLAPSASCTAHSSLTVTALIVIN